MPFITQGKNNWKFLLIVVALAVITGSGILWCQKNITEPEATTILSPDSETVDWKIYKNEEYGFEFTYPQTWTFLGEKEEMISNEDNVSLELTTGGMSNFQGFGLNIYTLSQYMNSPLERPSNDKLKVAIQKNDIHEFIEYSDIYSCKTSHTICRLTQYKDYVIINGKEGYAFVHIAPDDGIHIVKLLMLSKQRVFSITVNDASNVPITAKPLKDVLTLVDDRVYGKMLRSFKIQE